MATICNSGSGATLWCERPQLLMKLQNYKHSRLNTRVEENFEVRLDSKDAKKVEKFKTAKHQGNFHMFAPGGQGGQENRDCRRNHNFTLRFSVQVSEL